MREDALMTMTDADRADHTPPGKPKRRSFTAKYKKAILAEYEAGNAQERAALLRREGLYSSNISHWRSQSNAGALDGQDTAKRDTKLTPDQRRIKDLERQLAASEEKRRVQGEVIDVLGKTHALLERLSESAAIPPTQTPSSTPASKNSRR